MNKRYRLSVDRCQQNIVLLEREAGELTDEVEDQSRKFHRIVAPVYSSSTEMCEPLTLMRDASTFSRKLSAALPFYSIIMTRRVETMWSE